MDTLTHENTKTQSKLRGNCAQGRDGVILERLSSDVGAMGEKSDSGWRTIRGIYWGRKGASFWE